MYYDVCLIIPERPYLANQMALPHLGVLQVSSALKEHGYEVTVLDFANGYHFVEADWYGITATTADWIEAIKIKRWLEENGADRIMIGGPHVTSNPNDASKHFEYIGVGDGEVSAINIVKNGNRIAYGFLKDIDRYHPDKEAIDLWSYEFYIDGKRATSMVTTYSCLWGKCSFCSRYPKPFSRVRFHSVEWCAEEIEQIAELGFPAVMLYDDEFFTYPKRDKQIIRILGEYGMVWRCFLRSDYAMKNIEMIKEATDNGLREVLIGIESGSDKILKIINKGTDPEMNRQIIQILHDMNVKVKCAMIVGLPSESEETLKQTWEWCESVEDYVNDWDFTVFTPLPGSDIYNNPDKYDIEFEMDDIYTAYKGMGSTAWKPCKISTSSLSFEQILEWRDRFERRFKFKEVC